jgi:hypothetical protein
MKKNAISFFALLLVISSTFAQRSIIVSNSSDNDRKAEMVDIKISNLKTCFKKKSYVLKNNKGEEVPYQLVYYGKEMPQRFIFQAVVNAKSTAKYMLIEGQPAIVKPKTSARFVPERKDDLAWENDLAAYRMYGPALAKENPSNGVDLWLKCTDELVVDKRYRDELKNGLSYHVDHGTGMDCYTVGHTLGAGGIAAFASDSLWIGNHYDHYKVVENGPLRSVFTLTYDSVLVGNVYLKQEITITANAGSALNKAEVRFIGASQKMELATGVFLHDGNGNLQLNAKDGIVAYAEDAISGAKIPSGRNYVGVFVPVKTNSALRKSFHGILLTKYKVGKTFTYYFGGGWSKWIYPTDNDWFNAMTKFKKSVEKPLKVSII